MKSHTYFSPVPGMSSREQLTLLEIWRRNWAAQGWEPVVLTPKDAKQHPRYEELTAKFRAFPSINPPAYELACFHRWIAMSVVGGIMVDYDVVTNGFTAPSLHDGDFVSILCDNNPVPCAVYGSAQQYDNTLKLMEAYVPTSADVSNGRPHVSDMTIIQAIAGRLRPHVHDICKEYRARDWETAKLVHFAHGCTNGVDRVAVMRAKAEGVK